MQLEEYHSMDQCLDLQVSIFTRPHGMITIQRCEKAGIDAALSVKVSGFARLGGGVVLRLNGEPISALSSEAQHFLSTDSFKEK